MNNLSVILNSLIALVTQMKAKNKTQFWNLNALKDYFAF